MRREKGKRDGDSKLGTEEGGERLSARLFIEIKIKI